ncbi:hypothetical protein CDD83_2378 [Cordyceps sp. RAO-2017]|nr:hypothetical protein CDD83_2378 [Cordyceps sp. RAO-2017]
MLPASRFLPSRVLEDGAAAETFAMQGSVSRARIAAGSPLADTHEAVHARPQEMPPAWPDITTVWRARLPNSPLTSTASSLAATSTGLLGPGLGPAKTLVVGTKLRLLLSRRINSQPSLPRAWGPRTQYVPVRLVDRLCSQFPPAGPRDLFAGPLICSPKRVRSVKAHALPTLCIDGINL